MGSIEGQPLGVGNVHVTQGFCNFLLSKRPFSVLVVGRGERKELFQQFVADFAALDRRRIPFRPFAGFVIGFASGSFAATSAA